MNKDTRYCVQHMTTTEGPCPECAVEGIHEAALGVSEEPVGRANEGDWNVSFSKATLDPKFAERLSKSFDEDALPPPAAMALAYAANDRQVGGSHYRMDYQHWDFATDVGLHGLLWYASKYLTRWRQKNGAQDLEKSIHCLQKADETDIIPMSHTSTAFAHMLRFTAQLPEKENRAVVCMCLGRYDEAMDIVRDLLAAE